MGRMRANSTKDCPALRLRPAVRDRELGNISSFPLGRAMRLTETIHVTQPAAARRIYSGPDLATHLSEANAW